MALTLPPVCSVSGPSLSRLHNVGPGTSREYLTLCEPVSAVPEPWTCQCSGPRNLEVVGGLKFALFQYALGASDWAGVVPSRALMNWPSCCSSCLTLSASCSGELLDGEAAVVKKGTLDKASRCGCLPLMPSSKPSVPSLGSIRSSETYEQEAALRARTQF